MNRSEVQSKVYLIISNQLSITPDQLTAAARLEDDLNADSLDITEIIMSLEDEFQFTIEESVAARLKTLGETVDHICEAKGIPNSSPQAAEPPKNWPPTYTPAPSAPPATVCRDCKSCGAHSVTGAVCSFCGRAL